MTLVLHADSVLGLGCHHNLQEAVNSVGETRQTQPELYKVLHAKCSKVNVRALRALFQYLRFPYPLIFLNTCNLALALLILKLSEQFKSPYGADQSQLPSSCTLQHLTLMTTNLPLKPLSPSFLLRFVMTTNLFQHLPLAATF